MWKIGYIHEVCRKASLSNLLRISVYFLFLFKIGSSCKLRASNILRNYMGIHYGRWATFRVQMQGPSWHGYHLVCAQQPRGLYLGFGLNALTLRWLF
jgi:hypothetical protein